MNNEYSYLTDMQQNCKLYGMVEIDKLRAVWKSRKFAIQVPDSIVQSGLLPSIFDWSLLGQLMPAEQTNGELLLQQRINDLELLNSLTTSLQRIQILPEMGLDVDVIMGRPSYNVLVQDDGSILVKELPSLHIHVYAAETRAAAGQDCDMLNEVNTMAIEQRKQLATLISQKSSVFTKTETLADEKKHDEPEDQQDERTELAHDPNEELGEFEEFLERTCTLSSNRSKLEQQLGQQKQQQSPTEQQHEQPELKEQEQDQMVPPPTESPVPQIDAAVVVETRLRRRQPFWIRFGNWLRQSLPRLNQ